jgi:hypothetical protein
MIIAIIILGVLLAVAAAIIFCLWQVLKNTYLNTYLAENALEHKTLSLKKAYNDVYYPAHVLAKIEFGSPQEMKVVDFSMYDKYKLVGLTVYTTDTLEDYYGDVITELDGLDEDLLDELTKPVLLKNKVVFEISEGNWTWKSAE